jgi:tRNA pseudouridine55 synthase
MARRRGADGPQGLVVIDKETGWTSHDVVAKLRGLLGQRRTGHAGTLDPSATGVLLVGLGRSTRLLRFLGDTVKVYEGELVLGSTTSTLDADGDELERFDMSQVGLAEVTAQAEQLTGELLQVPPMVSAIKVDGQRLHALARQGIEIERAPRAVRVDRFDVEATEVPGRFRFDVTCSSGTYVRSLIDDLGRALGGGAHLGTLRRTAVGPFSLADAHTLGEVESLVASERDPSSAGGVVLSPAEALRGMATLVVDEGGLARVRTGSTLERSAHTEGDGPVAVLDEHGALLAVYRPTPAGTLAAEVVLVGGTS